MNERYLQRQDLVDFKEHLIREEKSTATVEKYLRDVRAFFDFAGRSVVTKELVIVYKKELEEKGYAVRSINSMLASINSFCEFMRWKDCKVKSIRVQRQIYCAEERELTRNDYMKLLKASEDQPQIRLIMQTICGTGIRVSELRYFTVEAIRKGEINVNCKNKIRTIIVPGKLRKMLLNYAKRNKIVTGEIFKGRNGKSLDRCTIWSRMKKLCDKAKINPKKVFPHNLRKLFARTFYKMEKDIAKLADVLGHGNIETTRIYIMSTGVEHRQKVERLGLVI